MKNRYIYIITFIILVAFIVFIIYYIKNKNVESFVDASDYSRKEAILNNCANSWGKIYMPNDTEEATKLACINNAWISEPNYLCGICDGTNNQLLRGFQTNNSENPILYGCSENTSNSIGLKWNQSSPVPTLNSFLSDRLTCNSFNKNAVSNMYIYVCCDDYCTITVNGAKIQKTINQVGWNSLGQYFIENISYGDTISISGTNVCGPGGICVSYVWNKQLYIMDNNGFNNCANIINYKVSGNTGWSQIWVSYVSKLPPWMRNWITMKDVNCSGQSSSEILSFKVGETQKNGDLTNNMTVFLGIDDNGSVSLNNNVVYTKNQGWNQFVNFELPNIKENDVLTVNCTNSGGPGGIGICLLWCGLLFTLPSATNGFNSTANILKYTSTNTYNVDYNASPVSGNLPFLTNWLNSCGGKCNFTLSTIISLNINNTWVYPPSQNPTGYTLAVNNLIGKWSQTNMSSSANMSMSFLLTIKTTYSNWRNIIHVTNDNKDCCNLGERVPALWVWPNSTDLHIRCSTTVNGNDGIWQLPGVSLNNPAFITVVWSYNKVIAYINGKSVFTQQFNGPIIEAQSNANFYMADPWYGSDGGVSIKNFTLYNYVMSEQNVQQIYRKEINP